MTPSRWRQWLSESSSSMWGMRTNKPAFELCRLTECVSVSRSTHRQCASHLFVNQISPESLVPSMSCGPNVSSWTSQKPVRWVSRCLSLILTLLGAKQAIPALLTHMLVPCNLFKCLSSVVCQPQQVHWRYFLSNLALSCREGQTGPRLLVTEFQEVRRRLA